MLIGIVGEKFSGKSTVAKIICDEYNAVELAFADPIKVICSMSYCVPLEYFYKPELKEKKDRGKIIYSLVCGFE